MTAQETERVSLAWKAAFAAMWLGCALSLALSFMWSGLRERLAIDATLLFLATFNILLGTHRILRGRRLVGLSLFQLIFWSVLLGFVLAAMLRLWKS
jgi:hypothetical protein